MQQNKVNKSKVVIATGLSREPCEKRFLLEIKSK